ncbi:hypothetical protein MLD38_040757 [Melastoma candidum]|nr:hypothetical protein MLD38_040757 [Melastoma candidum]
MKLDVDVLRYLSKDDFRVLTAVEMGMRNHEIVPSELVDRIASLKHGGTYKVLKNLLKHKLVHHDSSKYDGFRLTYLGYDFLAIKAMVNRGVFVAVGRQIGVGKESDIFEVSSEDGTIMAMKLHRLGRTSFRAVKSKRDYLKHRRSFNWLYLSRLAALKEFAFMKALEDHDFPVPNAIDCNRHCVIMSLVQGYPLVQVKELQNPELVCDKILDLVERLAENGLIHCDFNEFNIMIDDEEKVTMIDFPQMVSVLHRNAEMYFDRDVDCIYKFFRKRFNISPTEESSRLCFSSIIKTAGSLDKELAASGFTRKEQDEMERFIEQDSEKFVSDGEESADVLSELTTNVVSLSEHHPDLQSDEDLSDLTTSVVSLSEHHPDLRSDEDVDHEAEVVRPGSENVSLDEEPGQGNTEDAELTKQLNKQRRRAIAAARRGGKTVASRNSYKDKGGRSSHSSRIQKHLNAC